MLKCKITKKLIYFYVILVYCKTVSLSIDYSYQDSLRHKT